MLGGRPPTVADLPRLPYTEQRHHRDAAASIRPSGCSAARRSSRSSSAATAIPVGTTIFMPQWVIHRDRRWFDDPEVVPPRALGGGLMQRIHRYAYFPFGGGPRICIGNNFALMEAALVLATIARSFGCGSQMTPKSRLCPR